MAPPPQVNCGSLLCAAGHSSKNGKGICVLENRDSENRKIGRVLKPTDENELNVYKCLTNSYACDPVKTFIPHFHGVLGDFICLDNLLHGYSHPKVMDVKIGTRTFLESEQLNMTLRPDLFERIKKLYPAELTPDEKRIQAVTKYRWMMVHDKNSTIGTLGYRIDGVAGDDTKCREDVESKLHKIHTQEDTIRIFEEFTEVNTMRDVEDVLVDVNKLSIAEKICNKLRQLRPALEASQFVAQHEFIGTSILLVADANGDCGVFWIDFAKTQPLAVNTAITHRKIWMHSPDGQANQEDGLLVGLDNLIFSWDRVVQQMREDQQSLAEAVVQQMREDQQTLAEVALSRTIAEWRCAHKPQVLRGQKVCTKARTTWQAMSALMRRPL